MVCGLEGSLSAMLRVADLVPDADGVNVTLRVQLEPPARLDPQVFVCAKSEGLVPVTLRLLITIADEPPFVTVTTCGELVVPIAVALKTSDPGDTVIAATPIPSTGMF
jgi:hypothetical protein